MPFWPIGMVAAATSVEITGAPAEVMLGDVFQLTATAKDSSGNAVSGKLIVWTSLTPATATVDADGTVTVVGVGAVSIQAAVDAVTTAITISPAAAVASVTVTGYGGPITLGDPPAQLVATVRDAGGAVLDRPVAWTSSDEAVAVVDSTGRVFPVGYGTVTITATSGGQQDVQEVVVRGDISSLTIEAAPADGLWTLIEERLTLSALDGAGAPFVIDPEEVEVESSHPAFATVTVEGDEVVVSPLAPSGAQAVTITARLRGMDAQTTALVQTSMRSQILANGGVEWVPGAGDRQGPRTIGPGITKFELENGSQAAGPVCWIDETGRPRVVGDHVRHARKPPTVAGSFHMHNITVVGTDTVPIPGFEPASYGRIFAITDAAKLVIHATDEGHNAWRGGGAEFNVEADRFTRLGGRRWMRAFIYLRAPLAQDVGKEMQLVLEVSGQSIARRTVTLTDTPVLHELKGWVEGDLAFAGVVHFIFPPTLAAPSQVSVYGPGMATAEWDVPLDLITGSYRWEADTADGVATDSHRAFRAWPVGPLGLFIGDAAYNAAGASWLTGFGAWQDENGVTVNATGTTRNPDLGMHDTNGVDTLFNDITMPAGAIRRMHDTQETAFQALNAPDSTNLKGVGVLVVAYIAAGASGALPADDALNAWCRARNGDGGVKTGPMKRYRRIPNTNVWEYRGLTAPYPIGHTSTLFVAGIQNASAGTLRFDLGPLICAHSAGNGARDESGLWPSDYWPYWYGAAVSGVEARKQQSKAQRPSIYPQTALFNRLAGAYINRFAIPYDPAIDLRLPNDSFQQIVKQISDGGVTANFGDTLNSQFRCGFVDPGDQQPSFHMGLEAYPGSGNTSIGVGVSLNGPDLGLFSQKFTHYDIIMRWNNRAIVDWAINPVGVATVGPGNYGWRTDGMSGVSSGPDEFQVGYAWCPWTDRDYRLSLQGWGFGVCVVKGVMPSREACMAILRAWGPRQRIDFATGLKVAA